MSAVAQPVGRLGPGEYQPTIPQTSQIVSTVEGISDEPADADCWHADRWMSNGVCQRCELEGAHTPEGYDGLAEAAGGRSSGNVGGIGR